ncbi:YdcF family protein [Muricoccus radiodurans]|uniref:YdcF family protein n=1 Tax=Muricoccus radiodurans TaxID=2231721 RepID=UPI003CFB3D4D
MSAQAILTALALPPMLLALLALAGGLAAWRGRRWAGLVAAAAGLGLLLLATPMTESLLLRSLEQEAEMPAGPAPGPPGAIVVLGAEQARGLAGTEVGPLTLERLRAGAALQRRTGLPLLVTGGPLSEGATPIAVLMARSLDSDFGVAVRWVEDRAADTRENAANSIALLRAEGISSAYVVTHGWHMPRAREAFARLGYSTIPAPVRVSPPADGRWSDGLPRADRWSGSAFAIREWVGRWVYRLRDGT